MRAAYSSASGRYIALVEDGLRAGDGAHGGDWERAMFRRHLVGLPGPVLDLGCGPGHWTAYLHGLGADVTGLDLVPEFVDHARATHPGPEFRVGSMTAPGVADRCVAGILSWYSTIHLPPDDLDGVLAGFRRLLVTGGSLVIGFFDSEDVVAPFDHAVLTAYRWPVDAFSERLTAAGFTEVQRERRRFPERPDRRYAAIAARATG